MNDFTTGAIVMGLILGFTARFSWTLGRRYERYLQNQTREAP